MILFIFEKNLLFHAFLKENVVYLETRNVVEDVKFIPAGMLIKAKSFSRPSVFLLTFINKHAVDIRQIQKFVT